MNYYLVGICIGLLAFNISFSQSITVEQKAFLKENSTTLCLDSLQDQADWNSLLPHVKDKRFILLGELNHGSKEIFELRNSLIRFLHENLGINVILFESGIGELVTADMKMDSMPPSQMIRGLTGVWQTEEFIHLMDYVKSQNISISGFDVQRTGRSFSDILNRLVKQYELDTTRCNNLEFRYGIAAKELAKRNAVYDSLKTNITQLIGDYAQTKNELAAPLNKDNSRELQFATVVLENRLTYLTYMLQFLQDKDWSKRWAARDSAMASNVQWLVENVYGNQPMIIVGHNYHIGKYNENHTCPRRLILKINIPV